MDFSWSLSWWAPVSGRWCWGATEQRIDSRTRSSTAETGVCNASCDPCWFRRSLRCDVYTQIKHSEFHCRLIFVNVSFVEQKHLRSHVLDSNPRPVIIALIIQSINQSINHSVTRPIIRSFYCSGNNYKHSRQKDTKWSQSWPRYININKTTMNGKQQKHKKTLGLEVQLYTANTRVKSLNRCKTITCILESTSIGKLFQTFTIRSRNSKHQQVYQSNIKARTKRTK